MNALRHGLTSQLVVMPTEDPDAYQRHVQSFTAECAPKGAIESHLVQSLADISWRLNRVAALEANLIDEAESAESLSKALANLSMHSQRLSRQFERTAAHLRELQTTRRDQEQAELDKLLDIIEMHEYSGEPFDRTTHGFVFSDQEIRAGLKARTLHKLAHKANPYRYSSAA
jgi:arginine deiminase